MEEHYPHLIWKDWEAYVRTLSVDDIRNEEVKATYPTRAQTRTNLLGFFYDGSASNVVYLLRLNKVRRISELVY